MERNLLKHRGVLPVIVTSQFFCTSLWFAGNAVVPDLIKVFGLPPHFLGYLTSCVQLGFISGTLVFAILSVADRFSPSKVFFVSAIIAASCNSGVVVCDISVPAILLLRFLTGFFLAGIYPVGMKIVADHYEQPGRSLGFLVGALVLGTALPHLLKNIGTHFSYEYVFAVTSVLALAGGMAVFFMVPDGPFRKKGQRLSFSAFRGSFRNTELKAAAFGYFGHMWELYTFWAFVPVMFATYNVRYPDGHINTPLYSFLIIASGALSCAGGGILSRKFGVKRTAVVCLSLSGICCMVSPLFLFVPNASHLLAFLFIWGMAVVADSPMFSTLVAQHAPIASRGTTLTLVNCIGFSITIVSIQLLNTYTATIDPRYIYMLLGVGPVLGLLALYRYRSGKVGSSPISQ